MRELSVNDLWDIRELAQKLYFEKHYSPKMAVHKAKVAVRLMKSYFNGTRDHRRKVKRTERRVEGKSWTPKDDRTESSGFKVTVVETT